MKHSPQSYAQAVRDWDRVHRIIGKEDPLDLYAQSKESLLHLPKEMSHASTIVDIGAGSGLMGLAWLELSPAHKAVFVEPKKKSEAFLRNYVSVHCPELASRALIIGLRWEDVSRETVLRFAPQGYFCVARAFSGEVDLAQAWSSSEFGEEDCYVFSADIAHSGKRSYCLKRLSDNKPTG